MTRKIAFAALALMLAPTIAAAQGCGAERKAISASSCAAGHVWDPIQMTCVLQPSS